MKKYFLFLCGLFFATDGVAATPGCHSSIASEHERPSLSIDIDYCRIISECGSRIVAVPIEIEKEIAQILNGEGRDGDSIDPEMEFIFCAGRNGILTIVQESSRTNFEVADTVAHQQDNRARGP